MNILFFFSNFKRRFSSYKDSDSILTLNSDNYKMKKKIINSFNAVVTYAKVSKTTKDVSKSFSGLSKWIK